MKILLFVLAPVLLAACSNSQSTVRITADKPEPVAPVQAARTEPIFYNGKTYKLHLKPLAGGTYDLAVSGMAASQQKDAVAVATSSLRYFSCPDGKTGKLTNQPRYAESSWKMTARCG
jgi:hypothetical protein